MISTKDLSIEEIERLMRINNLTFQGDVNLTHLSSVRYVIIEGKILKVPESFENTNKSLTSSNSRDNKDK
jgi:hypothetical protein